MHENPGILGLEKLFDTAIPWIFISAFAVLIASVVVRWRLSPSIATYIPSNSDKILKYSVATTLLLVWFGGAMIAQEVTGVANPIWIGIPVALTLAVAFAFLSGDDNEWSAYVSLQCIFVVITDLVYLAILAFDPGFDPWWLVALGNFALMFSIIIVANEAIGPFKRDFLDKFYKWRSIVFAWLKYQWLRFRRRGPRGKNESFPHPQE